MATEMDHGQGERPMAKKRARLMIDVSPELRRRIKVAAARQDLSLREYVERLLEASVPAEASEAPRRVGRRMTKEALEQFRQLRAEFERAHPGVTLDDSAEIVREMREERADYLGRL